MSLVNQTYEMEKYFPLTKVDEKSHTTFGLVTCEKPDKDGELADYEGTKKAYESWSKEASDSTSSSGQQTSLGNIRYMHQLVLAGKATKLQFDDDRKQIWLETTPAPAVIKGDPDIWPLIEGGYLRGYSHGGQYVSRVCDKCRKDISGNFCKGCDAQVIVRYIPTISEVSYVDNPCLKDATFSLVKSDGSIELKKFSDDTFKQAVAKNTAISKLSKELNKLIAKGGGEKCTCKCANCEAGKCAQCSSDNKCEMAAKTAKAIKYLVEASGEKHLPYTDESGKPSHRLMGAAWAALFNEKGYRGNKYEGPDKEKAKKKLRTLYAQQGLDTPAEKAERVDPMLQDMLQTAILSKNYGVSLTKGLYAVNNFSNILENLRYLWISLEYERTAEEDESPVTDDIKGCYVDLLDNLVTYVTEEVEEAKQEASEREFLRNIGY